MIGRHHQYPDGAVLFLGTMFAPVKDRDAPGMGFTHHAGDVVTIAADRLGALDERGDDQRQGAGMDLRHRRSDAQSGEARVAVAIVARTPARVGESLACVRSPRGLNCVSASQSTTAASPHRAAPSARCGTPPSACRPRPRSPRTASRSPIHVRRKRRRVAERRDAADRVTGERAHGIGIGTLQLLAEMRRHALLVDAVRAGHEQQIRLAAVAPTNTSDFTICPTVTPQAAAASSAVRVDSAISRTAMSRPSARPASCTFCALAGNSLIARSAFSIPESVAEGEAAHGDLALSMHQVTADRIEIVRRGLVMR